MKFANRGSLAMANSQKMRGRPHSPNIQIYRPQLTSVLSIINRLTGAVLSLCSVVLVIWLVAAASGPRAYTAVQAVIGSWIGQIALLGSVFAFFLHLWGGIRHLVWDAGYGFEQPWYERSAWAVVIATVVATLLLWIIGLAVW